jgi:very-short-patch-repair endonuclease
VAKRTGPLIPLPEELVETAFSTEDARRLGVSAKRLRSRDLTSPFVGVRTGDQPADVRSLCAAYLPKLSQGEFFSHVTAAVIHEMWLPLDLERRMALDVSVVKPARAPRDRRVTGHHLVPRPGLVVVQHGFPVATAVETWCQLATVLSRTPLVVAGDSLLAKGRPDVEAVLGRLRAAALDGDRPYAKRLAAAAAAVRVGSRSAGESELRQALVQAGLPEPEMNAVLLDDRRRFLGEVDLLYRKQKVVIEYEGDYHRVDKAKWRSDVRRYERMQDAGYRVIRVTVEDLRDRPDETVARIRAALAAR